jgi:hypothetical protein
VIDSNGWFGRREEVDRRHRRGRKDGHLSQGTSSIGNTG